MRTVICGPMYHSAPFAFATLAARSYNGLLVIQDRFDPEELLALIERHRITSMYMVPTMFVRLSAIARRSAVSGYDLSSLAHVSHTQPPVRPTSNGRLIEWWGPIISELYGSTEVGFHRGLAQAEEWLAHPGTVGRPLASCEVRVFGEDGVELATGESGEVFVRAKATTDFTYHNKAEARAEVERDGLITCGERRIPRRRWFSLSLIVCAT